MKQRFACAALFLNTFVSLVAAKALLAVFDSSVALGQTYEVEWLLDSTDTLELLLVRQTDSGWSSVETLFENIVGDPPGSSYNWTVNSTLETGDGYGLWLSSTPVSSTDGSGYADLTDWFCVVADENSTCSTSSSALASTSTTSSASTTEATSTGPSQIANSTSTSGVLPSQTAASQNSSGNSNNDEGLSNGAIAGIVLGALVGFAIFLLIILWMLRRKHKEREAKASATAELNATTEDDRRPELGTDHKANRHELQGGSDIKPPVEKDGEALTSTEDSISKTEKTKLRQDPVEMP